MFCLVFIAPREDPLRSVVLLAMMFMFLTGCSDKDWRTASRAPAGIAPDPAVTSEAVVQVYAARAWGWRGWFAVHTWIATKPEPCTRPTRSTK